MTVALFATSGGAMAGPLNQYESGYSSQQTCLSWYDTDGVEQGSIQLCGSIFDGGYGESRSVSAGRWVQTCDADGQGCTDAYAELYSGPADATEFSMDIIAGTASFDIVLAGEDPGDQCTVQATAQASGSYTYTDPYPSVGAYGNPYYPTAWAHQGDTYYVAGASPFDASASLTQQDNQNASRAATGSGMVCNWVEAQSAGTGSMSSWSNTSTTYSVTPTQLP